MTEVKLDEAKGSENCTVTTDGGKEVRARLLNQVEGRVIFDDIKGSDEATILLADGRVVRAKIINELM